LLAEANMHAVMADLGDIPRATASQSTRKEHPYHIGQAGESDFYEMFLAHYDPQLREARGVYSTPQPLVSYIVRSVDVLLRSRFGYQDGLADTSTIPHMRTDEHGETVMERRPTIVMFDPACGTGAFLHGVIDHVRGKYQRTDKSVAW